MKKAIVEEGERDIRTSMSQKAWGKCSLPELLVPWSFHLLSSGPPTWKEIQGELEMCALFCKRKIHFFFLFKNRHKTLHQAKTFWNHVYGLLPPYIIKAKVFFLGFVSPLVWCLNLFSVYCHQENLTTIKYILLHVMLENQMHRKLRSTNKYSIYWLCSLESFWT